MEANDQATVFLRFELLMRVELELGRALDRLGCKTPHDLAILAFGLVGTEGPRSKLLDGKPLLEGEGLLCAGCRKYLFF